jgi:hypothetical protein
MRKIRFSNFETLETTENFVYQTIKHYKELWGVEDRAWSGRLKSVRAEATIKTVWEQIHQNPLWKQKIMSQELNISAKSVVPHQGRSTHESAPQRNLLTPTLKEIRWTRAERLLQRHAEKGHENILFKDEKFFTTREQ